MEDDFRAFAGAHANRFRPSQSWKRFLPAGWCWGAFFLSFVWFFWRRMILAGSLMIAVPLMLVMGNRVVPGLESAAALHAAAVLWGKACYRLSYRIRVLRTARLRLAAEHRRDYLIKAGGVSSYGALVSGILYGALWIWFATMFVHSV